jgi:hypothetical protein
VVPLPERVTLVARLDASADNVHIFVTERAKLKEGLRSCIARMRQDAAVWVSWPKRSSKVETPGRYQGLRSE